MELSREEINELLRCALNRNRVVYAVIKARTETIALLIAKGYMQASPNAVHNLKLYPTIKPTMNSYSRAWLTEQGKAAILALSPDDFKANRWWPLSEDVKRAAARVASEDTNDQL